MGVALGVALFGIPSVLLFFSGHVVWGSLLAAPAALFAVMFAQPNNPRSEIVTAYVALTCLAAAITVVTVYRSASHNRLVERTAENACESVRRDVRSGVSEIPWIFTDPGPGVTREELKRRVGVLCGADFAELVSQHDLAAERSDEAQPTLPPMSECDRRKYAVTHSGAFTDAEENELIRSINESCSK